MAHLADPNGPPKLEMVNDARICVRRSHGSGEQNDGLLAAFQRTPAVVRGTLFMMPAGYPALVPSSDGLPHSRRVY